MTCRKWISLTVIVLTARVCSAGAPAKLPAHAEGSPTRDRLNPFVLVFIDSATEKSLGPFPYDRGLYAKAVERAASLGARGVVVKFFLDKPKSPDGDAAFVRAM